MNKEEEEEEETIVPGQPPINYELFEDLCREEPINKNEFEESCIWYPY